MEHLVFQDQMSKHITLDSYPERIISLVPSQTELLFYLGLEGKIVGRTKFCVHPKDKVNSVQIIGGTKNPRLREVIALKPDIVIGNKEENEINAIQKIEELFPVWMSDIKTIDDALDMIHRVGQLTNSVIKAAQLIYDIKDKLIELDHLRTKALRKTCLYLIWKDPYMGVGSNTFVNDVIKRCGFSNIIEQKERYPQLVIEEIIKMSPDYIFLSSEPYPFKKKNVQDFEQLLPGTKVILVDGEMFSWYGNRMLKSIPYLNDLIVNL